MTGPWITTIIPTYRRPKLLKRAIRSVLNQTYSYFQVCIYDNASGDGTAEVVAEFTKQDPRVKYYCHPANIGGLANFNYGMSQVETPYFSFLSDDDILLPDFYEGAIRGFDEHADALFSAGSVISMTHRGEILGSQLSLWPRDGYYTPPEGLFRMIEIEHPTWTGVLFRKEVIQRIGLLDQEVGALVDMDFELRIAALSPFVISRKPCAIFVYHPSSFCSLMDLHHIWPGWLKIISNLTEDKRIPPHVRARAEEALTRRLISSLFGTGLIVRKEFEQAYRAAEILRANYNQTKKAAVLYTITKLCEHFPPAFFLLVGRSRIRLAIRWIKSQILKKQLGDYSRFLKLP